MKSLGVIVSIKCAMNHKKFVNDALMDVSANLDFLVTIKVGNALNAENKCPAVETSSSIK